MSGPPQIQSITFGERMVEISYMEEHEQSDTVMQVRTLAVVTSAVGDFYVELLDAARELLDAALVLKRNPDAAQPTRRGVDGA